MSTTMKTPQTSELQLDPELGENTPLIHPNGQDETPLRDIEDWTRREKAVAGVSAVSFATSVTGMLFNHNPLVYVSGTIGCAVAPYVAIQQQKITHVQALSETNERVKDEVEQLQGENNKLQVQVQQLSQSVQNLKVQKDKLDTINSVQGASVDELERQLGETRAIYEKLKDNLQGDVLTNLIDIALACDEDEDMMLSDKEIDDIIIKMEHIHGVEVDNEKVRLAIVKNGRSLDAIMALIKNVLRDDIPLKDNYFRKV